MSTFSLLPKNNISLLVSSNMARIPALAMKVRWFLLLAMSDDQRVIIPSKGPSCRNLMCFPIFAYLQTSHVQPPKKNGKKNGRYLAFCQNKWEDRKEFAFWLSYFKFDIHM